MKTRYLTIGSLVAMLAAISRCASSEPDLLATSSVPKHVKKRSSSVSLSTSYTVLAGAANTVTAQVLPDALCTLQTTGAPGGLEIVSDGQGNASFGLSPPRSGL